MGMVSKVGVGIAMWWDTQQKNVQRSHGHLKQARAKEKERKDHSMVKEERGMRT